MWWNDHAFIVWWANPGLFFIYLGSFQTHLTGKKPVGVSGIWTRTVRVEGAQADHLTTTLPKLEVNIYLTLSFLQVWMWCQNSMTCCFFSCTKTVFTAGWKTFSNSARFKSLKATSRTTKHKIENINACKSFLLLVRLTTLMKAILCSGNAFEIKYCLSLFARLSSCFKPKLTASLSCEFIGFCVSNQYNSTKRAFEVRCDVCVVLRHLMCGVMSMLWCDVWGVLLCLCCSVTCQVWHDIWGVVWRLRSGVTIVV